MPKIILCLLLLAFFSLNLRAQSSALLLRELLDLPAPAPRGDTSVIEKPVRPEEFFDEKNVPPDDAPIEDLMDFWKFRASRFSYSDTTSLSPSQKSVLRLFEAFEKEPEELSKILPILPIDAITAERVKFIFDNSLQSETISDSERWTVKNWLKHNTGFYIDELIAEAETIKDKRDDVNKSEALDTLVKLNWETAEPILKRLEKDSNNPKAAALAKTIFYQHFLQEKDENSIEKYRNELKTVVSDPKAPRYSRNNASYALAADNWPGRDDWFQSLMEDEAQLRAPEGYSWFEPLQYLSQKDPDKWIPILTRFVSSKSQIIHNTAVQNLMDFENRKDAFEPLLPWLFDEKWAHVPGAFDGWKTFIKKVSKFDFPEIVPALIRIVENESNNENVIEAAGSLAKLNASNANPALKTALARIKKEEEREPIIYALLTCGGLSADDQAAALEFYAEFISKPENFELVKKYSFFYEKNPLPTTVSIGKYLSKQQNPDDVLILRLIERQKILRTEKPAVSKILSGLMSKWESRLVDLEMLRQIETGQADLETIIGALTRRKKLNENFQNEIYAMRGKSSLPGGIAACLTENENEITSAFHSKDPDTQITSIACARMLHARLPLDELINLLSSPNRLQSLAAERYLETVDTPETRRLILARHKGEALILGPTDSFNPAGQIFTDSKASIVDFFYSVKSAYLISVYYPEVFKQFAKEEKKLRREVLENTELKEIYAFENNYIRVYKDRTVYSWNDDETRFREKVLSKEEFESFCNSLGKIDIENIRELSGQCGGDGCGYSEFIRLSRDGGRRVMTAGYFEDLSNLFSEMQKGNFKIHYVFEKYVSNLEILLADSNYKPQMIWKNGDDLRVLVADENKRNTVFEELQNQNKLDDADENLDYQERDKRARKRSLERSFEEYEWREFRDGKLGKVVTEPIEIPYLSDKSVFPPLEDLGANQNTWQTRSGDYEIRAGEFTVGDLWKVNRAEKIKIGTGTYDNPVVTPEGKWAVASKTDSRWDAPHYVVRVNLQTGKEFKINLPDAESIYPAAFIPEYQKILLYYGKADYSTLTPTIAQYFLLDPETGKTEPVKGEFQPFLIKGFRRLQPTGKAHEYWAVIYSLSKNDTNIGIYNARDFTFRSIIHLPEIILFSHDIWVDEKEGKIYLICSDEFRRASQLLRFDLPKFLFTGLNRRQKQQKLKTMRLSTL